MAYPDQYQNGEAHGYSDPSAQQYQYQQQPFITGALDQNTGLPSMGATFYPGQDDDWTMPQTELISPSPQRIMPEVPTNITDSIGAMEQRGLRFGDRSQARGGTPVTSPSSLHPTAPRQNTLQLPLHHTKSSRYSDVEEPSWSPFPKLQNPGPNIPPTDDEKERYLESARVPVLNSNDPETQLAWAQDALNYVETSLQYLARTTEGGRPSTPAVEYQLRTDAMNVVRFLSEQHHPKAEFIRGTWLEFGKFGIRVDKKEAFRAYARAAERGYARAEYRMGMQYENSNEPMKAIKHYTQGAALNDSASNYRLGMMTLLGQHGQKQDYARGVMLVRLAAQTADENAPQGAYVYGMLMSRELPGITIPDLFLPADIASARGMIEKAAFLGFARAQVKMAQAYELCQLGCNFDPALSLHYNALASRQGEPEADMSISKWFLSGQEGVFEKNEELAFKYAKQAADMALPTAEFALGYFYEIGMYVGANIQEAQIWYAKAAAHGNKDAYGRLDGISRSKTLSRKDHEQLAVSKIKASRSVRLSSTARRVSVPPAPTAIVNVDMPDPRILTTGKVYQSQLSTYPTDVRPNSPGAIVPGQKFQPFGPLPIVGPLRGSSTTPYPPSPTSTRPNNYRPSTAAPSSNDPQIRPLSATPGVGSRPASAAGGVLLPAGTYPINGRLGPQQRSSTAFQQPTNSTNGPLSSDPRRNDTANIPYPGFEAPLPVLRPLQPRKPPIEDRQSSSASPAFNRTPSATPQPQPGHKKTFSGGTLAGTFGRPQSPQAKPVKPLTPSPQQQPTKQSKPPPSQNLTSQDPSPSPASPPPAFVNKPLGAGPKTFEEMGVPTAQKEQDCIVM